MVSLSGLQMKMKKDMIFVSSVESVVLVNLMLMFFVITKKTIPLMELVVSNVILEVFYISFLILVLSDGTIVGITISMFVFVLSVVILIVVVILIFKGQYYLVIDCYINTLCTCVHPLVCRTKQSRGETQMVGQSTTNNTNSDTVSTAHVASTIVDTSQTHDT